MHHDALMDEHSMLAAFNQANGLPPPHCAMRQQTYVRAPRFIGLVEEFLTVLPAEHPKQTPLFILPARRLAREGGLPNRSRT